MDHYLKVGNENIHLSAILLSASIIAVIAIVLGTLLKRGVRQDFLSLAKGKLQQNKRRQDRARLPEQEEPEARNLQRKKEV